MSPARVKVLFVCGSGRSGSTILGNVLGALEGFIHVGQVRTLWASGSIDRHLCGCGRPVSTCPFWRSVLEGLEPGNGDPMIHVSEMNELRKRAVRLRYLPRILRAADGGRLPTEPLRQYADATERLYLAIADASRARVVIDSSKRPADAALICTLRGVDGFFLQLVRDPRAVGYSWQRHKEAPGSRRGSMARLTSGRSAMNWVLANVGAEVIRRSRPASQSIIVRYESFMAAPIASVERILQMIGESPADRPFAGDHGVRLAPAHTLGGNPDRFRSGVIELRPDREWVKAQSLRDRIVSTGVSLPLLRHYGYPILPRRGR